MQQVTQGTTSRPCASSRLQSSTYGAPACRTLPHQVKRACILGHDRVGTWWRAEARLGAVWLFRQPMNILSLSICLFWHQERRIHRVRSAATDRADGSSNGATGATNPLDFEELTELIRYDRIPRQPFAVPLIPF